jgi:SAM-dependent methyltransferase
MIWTKPGMAHLRSGCDGEAPVFGDRDRPSRGAARRCAAPSKRTSERRLVRLPSAPSRVVVRNTRTGPLNSRMETMSETETVESLILDLLEWVGPDARPYAEVIEAWRTSCPRLPVWEEANNRGFLARRHQRGLGELVCVSTLGTQHLRSHRSSQAFPAELVRSGPPARADDRPLPRDAPVRARTDWGIDQEYLRESQYKDPTNLNARITLHARYTRAQEPWYPWLVGRIEWPRGAHVLEVGCGTGSLWANVAPLLPDLRLTLTDLSEGMLETAVRTVASIASIEVAEARPCDVQTLPFPDAAFDIAVANHMLYHVPDPRQAAAELARVLRPDGVLLAATNGPHHLDAITELSRQALGWSALDFSERRFGKTTGRAILSSRFGSVRWHQHQSVMVCTDPDHVVAFIVSTAPFQGASLGQRHALEEAVRGRFAENGGSLRISTDAGCFVAVRPTPSKISAPVRSRWNLQSGSDHHIERPASAGRSEHQ